MKIPTLILLSLFLFIFKSCGQNGLNNGNLFLLQKDNNTISINSYKNEIINEINNFKISEKSIYTTDQKERVVVLDTAKMSLKIYDINSTKQSDISIPFDIKPKTILLNNENIFVGGEQGKEILIQFNLKSEKWYQLEIPKEIQTYGKAVDDLVINNSLLIAVDNIILPKYILYYNLNSKDKLEFSHLKKLKSNSSYESIHKARISNNNLGLLSTTVNHGTIREHITLYEDLNLLKSFAITIGYKKNGTFRDFIIVDDKLFIASSSKGLGVLKIKKSFFKESENRFDIFNAKVDENLINYKKIRNGEIIKLTKIPNEQKIILSIKNIKGEIRNEIREIK